VSRSVGFKAIVGRGFPGVSDYQDIAAALTARHLQTRYEELVGFDVNHRASDIHAKLEEAGYDFAPVTEGDRLVGRIGQHSVAGHTQLRAGDLLERLSPRFLIASNSDVGRVMTWLVDDPWLLVVDGNRVTGVVTPSDLNRQAGRTYLYLLITDFESRLADSIRRIVGPKSAVTYLSESRQIKVLELFLELKNGEVEVDEVAAMQLSDLVAIGKKQAPIRLEFGVHSATEWRTLTGSVIRLRHAVMHATRPFLSDRIGLAQLTEDRTRLQRLLGSHTDNESLEGV
jgi:hypothetical protein